MHERPPTCMGLRQELRGWMRWGRRHDRVHGANARGTAYFMSPLPSTCPHSHSALNPAPHPRPGCWPSSTTPTSSSTTTAGLVSAAMYTVRMDRSYMHGSILPSWESQHNGWPECDPPSPSFTSLPCRQGQQAQHHHGAGLKGKPVAGHQGRRHEGRRILYGGIWSVSWVLCASCRRSSR